MALRDYTREDLIRTLLGTLSNSQMALGTLLVTCDSDRSLVDAEEAKALQRAVKEIEAVRESIVDRLLVEVVDRIPPKLVERAADKDGVNIDVIKGRVKARLMKQIEENVDNPDESLKLLESLPFPEDSRQQN